MTDMTTGEYDYGDSETLSDEMDNARAALDTGGDDGSL